MQIRDKIVELEKLKSIINKKRDLNCPRLKVHDEKKCYAHDERKFYQRFLYSSDGVISVIVATILAANTILPMEMKGNLSLKRNYYLSKPFKYLERPIDNEEISFDDFEEALNRNKSLTNQEKEFVLRLENQIEENKDYVDYKFLINVFKNLKIIYGNKKFKYANFPTKGFYHPLSKIIYMSQCSEEKNFENWDLTVLDHEVNHIFEQKMFCVDAFRVDCTSEMFNELARIEYDEDLKTDTVWDYDSLMRVVYPLCEILEPEDRKQIRYQNGNTALINALLEIDPDLSKATNLITSINLILHYENDYYKVAVTEEEIENAKKKMLENKKRIYNLIKNYYEKKFHRNMEDDIVMMYYFDMMGVPDLSIDVKEKIPYTVEKINRKGYLSEKYINEHPHLEIFFTADNHMYKGFIYDEDRYNGKITIVEEIDFSKLYDKKTQKVEISGEYIFIYENNELIR